MDYNFSIKAKVSDNLPYLKEVSKGVCDYISLKDVVFADMYILSALTLLRDYSLIKELNDIHNTIEGYLLRVRVEDVEKIRDEIDYENLLKNIKEFNDINVIKPSYKPINKIWVFIKTSLCYLPFIILLIFLNLWSSKIYDIFFSNSISVGNTIVSSDYMKILVSNIIKFISAIGLGVIFFSLVNIVAFLYFPVSDSKLFESKIDFFVTRFSNINVTKVYTDFIKVEKYKDSNDLKRQLLWLDNTIEFLYFYKKANSSNKYLSSFLETLEFLHTYIESTNNTKIITCLAYKSEFMYVDYYNEMEFLS